ncbi:nucleoside deaminase [Frankia sp. EAN1pec]|uniref:deaminase n=1 Tax=Parafrankia sp. (strain EAN1pec) TaxID=298653 RepID=UPI0018DB7E6E
MTQQPYPTPTGPPRRFVAAPCFLDVTASQDQECQAEPSTPLTILIQDDAGRVVRRAGRLTEYPASVEHLASPSTILPEEAMTVEPRRYKDPHEAWAALDTPWHKALEMAWESYLAGGVGVGAILTDSGGRIIGYGRNQRFASASPRLLAHAEMEALAALPPGKDRAHDAVLYTTLHPCPMCLGAVVVARIGQVRFGAFDPTWLGIEHLPDLNEEVRRRWPAVIGPLAGPLGEWAAVLPALNTNGSLLRAMETVAPQRAHRARVIADRLEADRPDTTSQALEQVWDLLINYNQ